MIDQRLQRPLLAVLAILLLQFALRIPGYTTGLVATGLSVALVSVALLAGAVTLTSPSVEHARSVAGLSVAVCSLAGIWIAATASGHTTDAFTFTQYAGELVLHGENPYPATMEPAFNVYAREPLRPTYRVDGSRVTTYSYPAGSILYATLGAALTALHASAFYVLLAVLLSTAAGVVYVELPKDLAVLAPVSFLAAGNLWISTAGGIIDAIWLLPLIATMAFWRRDQLAAAGVCFGIAVAAKQQPWLIAPAALIVLARTRAGRQSWTAVATFVAPAAGVFAVINLPFFVADPVAWLKGVFVAVDLTEPSIIQDGVGIVALSTSGTVPLSSTFLGGLTLAAAAVSYVVVYWRPERVRHAIWLIPPLVLFWSPRSLASYFTMFAPVAALAAGNYIRDLRTNAR